MSTALTMLCQGHKVELMTYSTFDLLIVSATMNVKTVRLRSSGQHELTEQIGS